MKASPILQAGLLAGILAVALPAGAVPRAAESSGAHYLVAAEPLARWHLGGFYRYHDREIKPDDDFVQNKAGVHVGYDLLPWLSVYGVIGASWAKIEPYPDEYSDAAPEFGGGVWLNLLDHDIAGNLALETRLRIQAQAQVTHASLDNVYDNGDVSYTEFFSSLTVSVINELIGNKNYWPDAIGIFAGPVVNSLHSDEIDNKGGVVGITAGIDMYVTSGLTLSFAYEAYEDDEAMNASLSFRF
jgi:opacity protein-like surface antigen